MTPLLRTLLAGGALLATAGAAHADTAIATTALNVRAGPGTSYPVIDTLPEGEAVNVLGCTGSWCEISMGAQGTGFASASYLDRAGGAPSRSTVIIDEYEPEVITGLSIGGYWDSRPYYYDDGFYYWGGRWYSERPGRSGWERSWRRDHHRGRHHGRGG
ncbi:SH3 domain-containing protein, partial [Hansschlegelia beijingensis]|uniref:SH3 domain-containing protein n=1 Tax=Hansschlegelia beijingensis TaxID=1133344 RepID=UPI003808DDD7